jgi:hypothetical protein
MKKSLNTFSKDKSRKDGHHAYCKLCKYGVDRKSYLKNKKERNNKVLQWHNSNKEKCKLISKNYYEKNKRTLINKSAKYRKERLNADPLFKISSSIRTRLGIAIKQKAWNKNNTFKQYIGCSLEELKKHIETQFQPGMNWSNHGRDGWHLDHIIPLSSARNEEELYKLNHYSNLQPLWAKDNLRKSDNYVSQVE